MPVRHRFYDPIVQVAEPEPVEEAELPPVSGIYVDVPGVYILAADVAAALLRMAAEVDGEARSALVGAAESFSEAAVDLPVAEAVPEQEEPLSVSTEPVVDDDPEVARVEIFPDQEGKWYARPVRSDGSIVAVTDGSIDRDYVERDATVRWPGKEIFELGDAMGDSIWDEQHHAFGFNGRRRPSPRRLWSS